MNIGLSGAGPPPNSHHKADKPNVGANSHGFDSHTLPPFFGLNKMDECLLKKSCPVSTLNRKKA